MIPAYVTQAHDQFIPWIIGLEEALTLCHSWFTVQIVIYQLTVLKQSSAASDLWKCMFLLCPWQRFTVVTRMLHFSKKSLNISSFFLSVLHSSPRTELRKEHLLWESGPSHVNAVSCPTKNNKACHAEDVDLFIQWVKFEGVCICCIFPGLEIPDVSSSYLK